MKKLEPGSGFRWSAFSWILIGTLFLALSYGPIKPKPGYSWGRWVWIVQILIGLIVFFWPQCKTCRGYPSLLFFRSHKNALAGSDVLGRRLYWVGQCNDCGRWVRIPEKEHKDGEILGNRRR